MKNFDDLARLDKHKIFNSIDIQPDHLRINFADEMQYDVTPALAEGITNIVFTGMGGSALAADITLNWLSERLSLPCELVRHYKVPGYVNSHSLVIISSYSGNTEETLSALDQAKKCGARIVIMTAGGRLLELANEGRYVLLKLPQVSQPRLSVFAGVKALACLFSDMGIVGTNDLRRELEAVADWLDVEKAAFNLDNTTDENQAKVLARHLYGKIGLIYSGFGTRSAAYKWKIDIDENAKQLAYFNYWPELNHNEMQGWLFPKNAEIAAVQLCSPLEDPRINKRIKVTNEVIARHGYQPQIVEAKGETIVAQLLWLILLGDYVSAYLGILNGIDPTPVDLVESFKKKLG